MPDKTVLILHRKSANEPAVMEAVKTVKQEGVDLRVLVPFNKAEKTHVVRNVLERGAKRIIAGGGDRTINAVVNALASACSQEQTQVQHTAKAPTRVILNLEMRL